MTGSIAASICPASCPRTIRCLDRGQELAHVATPTLVIDAPLDPVFAPPHAEHLALVIPTARLVTIPRMGHALPAAVLPALADAILTHTTEVAHADA
jgi:pimeloyl-ACP methyl ester carboxylesterase